jgi:hypothetical protein
MSAIGTGYCDCACRDCFDIAIGTLGEALCNDCEEAGCEAGEDCECSRPDAYGVCDHDETDCDCDETPEEHSARVLDGQSELAAGYLASLARAVASK